MNWLYYLLEANLYLGIFFAVYYLLLRRETFYQLNRAYLILTSFIAFILPLMQLGILKQAPEANPNATVQIMYTPPSQGTLHTDLIHHNQTNIDYYLLGYSIIAAILFINLGYKIYRLWQLMHHRYPLFDNGRYKLIAIEDEVPAFSFFNCLFINSRLSQSNTVIQHELVHIRQRHSWDIMYLELLKIACWFNPVVYLLQNSLKELHEYIADSQINYTKQDIDSYTDFLINNAYGNYHTSLTNNFFHKNLLKKRIIMLHQKPSGYLARLKYLTLIPAVGGMLCISTLAFAKSYGMLDLLPAKLAGGKKDFAKLANYIKDKARYTREGVSPQTRANAHIGMLTARVTLNNQGKLQDVNVFQGVNTPLMNELTRVIKSFPEPIDHKAGKYLIEVDFVTPAETADGSSYVRYVGVFDNPNKPEELFLFDGTSAHAPQKQTGQTLSPPPPPSPVPVVTRSPYFALIDFMVKNFRLPQNVDAANLNNSAAIDFKLDGNGQIQDIKIAQSAPGGIDEEVIRLMRAYKTAIPDKAGHHIIGINFFAMGKGTPSTVSAPIKNQADFAGEFFMPFDARTRKFKNTPPPPPPAPPVSKKFSKVESKVADTSSYHDFYKYIAKSTRYPAKARDNNVGGKVFVTFTVDENKNLAGLKILRTPSQSLSEEVARVLKSCTDFSGFTAGQTYTIPVSFNIQSTNGQWVDLHTDDTEQQGYINFGTVDTHQKMTALNEVVVVSYSSK